MEKRKPTYDLAAFKSSKFSVTGTAVRGAANLGYGRVEIVSTIQSMKRAHFYKSMTSFADHRVWQDVFHVPSEVGTLYIKFTADVVSDFLLLSFKEKRDD